MSRRARDLARGRVPGGRVTPGPRGGHAPPTIRHFLTAVRPGEGQDAAGDGGQRRAGLDSLPKEEVVADGPILHRGRGDLGHERARLEVVR